MLGCARPSCEMIGRASLSTANATLQVLYQRYGPGMNQKSIRIGSDIALSRHVCNHVGPFVDDF